MRITIELEWDDNTDGFGQRVAEAFEAGAPIPVTVLGRAYEGFVERVESSRPDWISGRGAGLLVLRSFRVMPEKIAEKR